MRLPAGVTGAGVRLQARAHVESVVGVLSVDWMREAVSKLNDDEGATLLDVTLRAISRHLCDFTTAQKRATPCRLASQWGFFARDLPRRVEDGVAIDAPFTHDDLTFFVDVERPAVTHAMTGLSEMGFIQRLDDQHYILTDAGRTDPGTGCALCQRGPTQEVD